MCVWCRNIYIIHFLHSKAYPMCCMCSAIAATFSQPECLCIHETKFLSGSSSFVVPSFLTLIRFLQQKRHSFLGNKNLEGVDFLGDRLWSSGYDNLLRISNDQDFLWTIGNTYDAILLILSLVHRLNQVSSHKPLSFDKLNLYLLWVSFLWHFESFLRL